MTNHPRLPLLVLGIAGLLLLPPAKAQGPDVGESESTSEHRSHVPLGTDLNLDEARKLLNERLQQAQIASDRLRQAQNASDWQKLLAIAQRNRHAFQFNDKDLALLRSSPSLDDPKARELVKGILANPVLGKLDPQLVARLRQLIHQTTVQQGGSLPGGEISGFSSSSSSPSDPQLDNRSGPKPDPGTSPDTAPSGLSAQQNEKPPPPSTRSLSPQMAERLKQFAERLRNSSLGDSPAVQRLIEGLGKVRVGNDSDPSLWEKWGTDLAGRLESWGSHLSQDFALPKIDLPQPRVSPSPKGATGFPTRACRSS